MDLPPNVLIKESSIPGAGLGAFAAKPIFKNEILGDYTGRECTEDDDGDYVLLIEGYDSRGRRVNRCIDAQDPETSAWPRYLNSIRRGDGRVANCKFFINNTKVSVRAIVNIPAGTELLVNYGDEYF